jgi:hypothetical protein
MTWYRRDDGYEVFFNRDERRSRKPGIPPRIQRRGTTRYIAPADGDFGGSWIAVNECGVTLALENGYVDLDDRTTEPSEGFSSRGRLLTGLIDELSIDGVLTRLETGRLRPYRSFLLTMFDADGGGVLARWFHGQLSFEHQIDGLMPIVSSSFETEEVSRSRRDLFARMVSAGELESRRLHLAFHGSHLPERGPRSTCMHRPDAETVSFSRVEVDRREVRLHYVGHAPCRGLPSGPPLVLPRRAGC